SFSFAPVFRLTLVSLRAHKPQVMDVRSLRPSFLLSLVIRNAPSFIPRQPIGAHWIRVTFAGQTLRRRLHPARVLGCLDGGFCGFVGHCSSPSETCSKSKPSTPGTESTTAHWAPS